MKKDDIVRVTIEDMGTDGAGIGKVDGFALFIKDAVIGDVADVKIMKLKKNYGYARLMNLEKPSPDRVEPICPVSRQCGGCQIQSMAYEKQLEFKNNKVWNNLKRIGGVDLDTVEIEPACGMEHPFAYRNKAQFPFGKDKEGRIIAGFYAGRTHSIISNTKCVLGVPQNHEILTKIIAWMEEFHVQPYDEKSGKGLIRHALIRYGFTTKELMVCLIINAKSLEKLHHLEKLVESLKEIDGMTSVTANCNTENTNVIMGRKMLSIWGQDYIEDYIGNVKYRISPMSFYQVNPVQTRHLYEKALEYADLTGEETVWDLYCGIGTISLFLAQKAKKVYGVEIVPAAIEDAKVNAALNDITNAEFFVGKAEEVLPVQYQNDPENAKADVIVVDPPRKGCDETLLKTIVEMQPKRVVYVSCDSATLARDVKYLCAEGYQLIKGQVTDQFCQTVHCESVVLLSRKDERK